MDLDIWDPGSKPAEVTPAGQVTRLMDVSAKGSQLADFEYVPEEERVPRTLRAARGNLSRCCA